MGGHLEQLAVLVLGEMLGDVHVKGRTSVEIFHIVISVELELVNHRK